MILKVHDRNYKIEFTFLSPGSIAPWQAEAFFLPLRDDFEIPDCVASGTTPDIALQALGLELSEGNY